MSLRFDDDQRVLTLSVRDLVELGFRSGHLSLEIVRSAKRRLAEGRAVHEAWQTSRGLEDEAFEAEKSLRVQIRVGEWTVDVQGRVDGLSREGQRTLVEEVKSVALDHDRLFTTTVDDYPSYAAQVEVYLWMLGQLRHVEPVGRLVLVSLVDGSRHVLGVTASDEEIDGRIRRWLARVLDLRDDRIAWLRRRRDQSVPWPFDGERPGQAEGREHVHRSLDLGRVAMLEAPTGLGKTAAVLVAALRHAFAEGRQVFWATARTTQQSVAVETARRLIDAGLELRVVVITAKDKVCLNDVVDCRPETCRFAYLHHDKVQGSDLLQRVWGSRLAQREGLQGLGREFEVCPYQLASDAARNADLIIGDYNYAFDPDLGGATLFGEALERWVVVVDEAHQLVERARGYGSPAVRGAVARQARQGLAGVSGYARFVELCDEILALLRTVADSAAGTGREAVVELDARPWRRLVEQLDDVAVDYGVLKANQPAFDREAMDPWLDLARSVLRLADAIDRAGPETVSLVRHRSDPDVSLLCLDPSTLVGPRFAKLGGAALCSATLSPARFYRDLLGLGEEVEERSLAAPFPPGNRAVIVAPRVSTRFRDRQAHAPRTADLLQRVVAAVPGNVALYFPSFAMLEDLVERLDIGDRDLLRQRPGMTEGERAGWLAQLREAETPTVLAAALGGVFAEGVDLPGGALQAAVVIGPALPPIGLERQLLRDYYEERYGAGFAYASLIPGMTKVIQAAGRVVRGPEDRGVVVLVGQRFRWRDHAALLPDSWVVQNPDDPVAAVYTFFEVQGETPPGAGQVD